MGWDDADGDRSRNGEGVGGGGGLPLLTTCSGMGPYEAPLQGPNIGREEFIVGLLAYKTRCTAHEKSE